MKFVRLRRAVLCDNCHCYATKRLQGITGLVCLYLCDYCINHLREALDGLARDQHPEKEVTI